jgi:hypothetical protein
MENISGSRVESTWRWSVWRMGKVDGDARMSRRKIFVTWVGLMSNVWRCNGLSAGSQCSIPSTTVLRRELKYRLAMGRLMLLDPVKEHSWISKSRKVGRARSWRSIASVKST